MAYIPNADDAFAVYMIAMAYFDDIPLSAFGPSSLMNVKQLDIKNEFYIWDQEELDVPGRYHIPLAACTYDESSQTWSVELSSGQSVQLRDVGDVWSIVKQKRKG